MLSLTTQDNDSYEQTPAASFLHKVDAKQTSLICCRDHVVHDNETLVFVLKSMIKWSMSYFELLARLAVLKLVKSAINIHMFATRTVTSSITISP